MKDSKLVLRAFNQEDWMGFSGATQLSDDQPPMISDEVDREDEKGDVTFSRSVIVDANGVTIQEIEISDGSFKFAAIDCGYEAGVAIASALTEKTIFDFALTE